MKRFLTILSVAALSAFSLQSCLSDQVFQGPPSIDAVSISPKVGSVTPNDDVTVTAKITVTESEITAVALRYTVAQGMENMVNMTKSEENTYTAVIPKQEDGKEVEYYINAVSSNGKSAESAKMKYTVSWTRSEYGKLSDVILSEISTGTKFIEIYNTSSLPVDIGGIRFAKNGTKDFFANADGPVVVP
ncbi:MAG: hypothetical protein HUJ91_05430, partial [Bacteroidales bacterium]|nr:hypothetical protein [Bacteroidales bacterium]